YAITVDVPWCFVIPDSGSLTAETDTVAVHFATEGLPIGVHTAAITVADISGQNPPATVTVTLTLQGLPADADGDRDVDQDDFGKLQVCLTGPGIAQPDPNCRWARLDEDLDVD